MTFTEEQVIEFGEMWSEMFGADIHENHPLYNACKLYFEMKKEIED
jgi:hypothetical protein